MEDQSILDRVRVASPCTARWEDMTGDDRSRFCRHCQKHVFNLSSMTRSEAEALVVAKEGKFCGRFHQRSDGRMLTADCPTGRRLRRRRLAKIWAATFGLVALMTTAVVGGMAKRGSAKGEFVEQLDEWLFDLKVRLGLARRPMIVGMICVTPAPAPAKPTNAPAIMGEIMAPPATNSAPGSASDSN